MGHIYITALHMLHGGVEKVIASLANAFTERGYQVTILCSYRLGDPVYRLDEGVEVVYLTDRHPNREEFRKALSSKNPAAILREAAYAVSTLTAKKKTMIQAIRGISSGIIISTRNEHSVLLSKYGGRGVIKIAQLHHDHMFNRKLIRDFRFHYSNIDRFVLLTPRLCREVKEFMAPYNHHTQCITIENFFDPDTVGTGERTRQVVSVGRLHREKGFDRLLETWAKAQKSGWTLKIIGGGSEMDRLKEQAAGLEISDSVIFTGMLPYRDVLDEMHRSQIYAMTSHTECFPLVLLEAMVNGLPVAALDVRVGPEAIICDGKDGFLVREKDLDGFAEKLSLLMADDGLRQKMGENAAVDVQRFSRDRIVGKWEDAFASCRESLQAR